MDTASSVPVGRRRSHWAVVLGVVCAAALLAGCGSGSTAGPDSYAAKVRVIRGWADALRRGDINGAARFFALPSVFANTVGAGGALAGISVRTLREARVVNASLSCGAVLLSTQRDGRFIVATFRLTNRRGPGAGCGSGVGGEATTAFIIRHGRIVDWLRGPDPGTTPGPLTVPAPPSSTTGSGEAI
jgi:hypothetical protein